MERKVIDNCVVFFDRDVDVEELKKLFPQGFSGDIVINGNLICSAKTPSKALIYGNLWILGDYKPNILRNINKLIIDGSLYSESIINVGGDLEVKEDLILHGEICIAKISVYGDFIANGYVEATDIVVKGNFVNRENVECCQVIVGRDWKCYGRASTYQVIVGHKLECDDGIHTNGYPIMIG